ncbi:hypothetical protein V3C99_014278 [Haemonchus contortus]
MGIPHPTFGNSSFVNPSLGPFLWRVFGSINGDSADDATASRGVKAVFVRTAMETWQNTLACRPVPSPRICSNASIICLLIRKIGTIVDRKYPSSFIHAFM